MNRQSQLSRTQALMAQQPYNTGNVGPGLQRMPRPEVPNDPRHLDRELQWNAQQKPLQAGSYGDGGFMPPQVPVVDARPARPATASMSGVQREGDNEAMMPAVGAHYFQQFASSSMPHPLDGVRNADTDRMMGESLTPGTLSKYSGRPLGLPLPPERTDGPSVAQQLATKGAPPPGSESWRTIFGASDLQALNLPEQLYAPGMQVRKK